MVIVQLQLISYKAFLIFLAFMESRNFFTIRIENSSNYSQDIDSICSEICPCGRWGFCSVTYNQSVNYCYYCYYYFIQMTSNEYDIFFYPDGKRWGSLRAHLLSARELVSTLVSFFNHSFRNSNVSRQPHSLREWRSSSHIWQIQIRR